MATIATAEVEVIADTSRFVADLRRKLRASVTRVGDVTGKQLSDRINKSLQANVGNIRLNSDRIAQSVDQGVRRGTTSSLRDFNTRLRRLLAQRGIPVRFDGVRSLRELADLMEQEFSQRPVKVRIDSRTAINEFNVQLRELLGQRGIPIRIDPDDNQFRGAGARARRAFTQGFGSTFNLGNLIGSGRGGFSIAGFLGRSFMAAIRAAGTALSALGGAARRLFDALGFGGDIIDSIQERLGNLAANGSRAAQALGQAVGAIQSAAGPAGAIAGVVVALIAATSGLGLVVVAIGAVIQLVQSLLGLLALVGTALNSIVSGAFASLPAVLAGLGVAVLAVTTAFDGFFAAIKEGPGSTAMGQLSSEARAAATELFNLKEAFDDLSSGISDSFWDGLSDNIRDLGETFLPALAQAADDAAAGLNDLLGGLIDGLASPEVAGGLAAIGEALRNAFSGLAGPLEAATRAFGALAEAGAPVLERLAGAAGDLFEDFAAWVAEAESTGELQEIFDKMYDTLSLIGDSVGNIIEGFGNLFGFIGDESLTFLENIRGATESFLAWSESEDAKTFMEFIAGEAMEFASAINGAVSNFVTWASSAEGQELMETLKQLAIDFAETFGAFFASFLTWAESTSGQALMAALVLGLQAFFGIWTAVFVIITSIEDALGFIFRIITDMFGAVGMLLGPISNVNSGFRGWLGPLNAVIGLLRLAAALAGQVNEFEGARSGSGPTRGNATPRRMGGIIRSPEYAWLAEDGRPEVVIPLTRPQRAMDLMAQSGLLDMVLGRAAGGGQASIPVKPSDERRTEIHVHSNSVNPNLVAHRVVNMIARTAVAR